jgi:molybdopterin synthase sulfur carrier subunit
MPTVKLFGGLRNHVDNHELDIPGGTVQAILDHLCQGRDDLKDALFDGPSLAAHIRVMVNGRDIELDHGLMTTVSQDDQIAIFPPIAGG